MARLSKKDFERLYRDLGVIRRDPSDPRRNLILTSALESKDPHLCARAGRVIAETRLPRFEKLIVAAYETLFTKDDPGCLAKIALADGLDFVDYGDEAPFRRGVGHREPRGGDPTDDPAAGLRIRCGLALVRLRVPDAMVLAADLFVDPVAGVRSAAAGMLSYHGDEKGVPLLRFKLNVGDVSPEVIADVLGAYVRLAPEAGLERAKKSLLGTDPALAEGIALALGESRVPAAFWLLKEFVERAARGRELRVGFAALLTLRTDESLAFLREIAAGQEEPHRSLAREVAGPLIDEQEPEPEKGERE